VGVEPRTPQNLTIIVIADPSFPLGDCPRNRPLRAITIGVLDQ